MTVAIGSALPPVLRGALWMIGTVASFTLMMVSARELTSTLPLFEILAFRSAIALVLLSPLVAVRGKAAFATRRPGFHMARNAVHFGGQAAWVYGIALMPLASVTALEFTTPLWGALLAVVFLGERLTAHRAVATFFGFAGILVILRPGIETLSPAAIVVLAGAALYAASNVMVKSLTRTDSAAVIVFNMQVMQLPLGLIPALFGWVHPGWADVPWLVVIAFTGLSAHYCMARALALADATVVIPIEFLRLPCVAVTAWAVYAERPELWVLLGAVAIFGGNYYSVRRETRPPRSLG